MEGISIGNIITNSLYCSLLGVAPSLHRCRSRLDILYVEGKISLDDRDNLVTLAGENAQDSQQIDVVAKLKELEDRIYTLEHPVEPDYPIYVPGYVTKKGEIIRFDYDSDGVYDLLRYDGGRAETSLPPR